MTLDQAIPYLISAALVGILALFLGRRKRVPPPESEEAARLRQQAAAARGMAEVEAQRAAERREEGRAEVDRAEESGSVADLVNRRRDR